MRRWLQAIVWVAWVTGLLIGLMFAVWKKVVLFAIVATIQAQRNKR